VTQPPPPPAPNPRSRRKQDARARILAEARRIVLEQGYGALTMRGIAQAAGYSAAALYLHFDSREAIARALGSEGMRSLHGRLSMAAVAADPLERLSALGLAYAAFAHEEAETYRLIFMEPGFAETALGGKDEAGAAAFALLAGAFVDLSAAGRLREGLQPLALARTFWVTLHGIVSLKMTCSHFLSTPAPEVFAEALDCLLRGLLRCGAES